MPSDYRPEPVKRRSTSSSSARRRARALSESGTHACIERRFHAHPEGRLGLDPARAPAREVGHARAQHLRERLPDASDRRREARAGPSPARGSSRAPSPAAHPSARAERAADRRRHRASDPRCFRSSRIGGCPAIQARIISTRSAGGSGAGAEARKRLSMPASSSPLLPRALDVFEHRRSLAAREAAGELVEEVEHDVSRHRGTPPSASRGPDAAAGRRRSGPCRESCRWHRPRDRGGSRARAPLACAPGAARTSPRGRSPARTRSYGSTGIAGVPVLGQRRLPLAAEELDDLPVDDLVDHHAVRDGVAASAGQLADQPLDHAVRHLVGVRLVAQTREATAEDDLVVGREQRRVVARGEQTGVLGVSLIPHPRGSRLGHGRSYERS